MINFFNIPGRYFAENTFPIDNAPKPSGRRFHGKWFTFEHSGRHFAENTFSIGKLQNHRVGVSTVNGPLSNIPDDTFAENTFSIDMLQNCRVGVSTVNYQSLDIPGR